MKRVTIILALLLSLAVGVKAQTPPAPTKAVKICMVDVDTNVADTTKCLNIPVDAQVSINKYIAAGGFMYGPAGASPSGTTTPLNDDLWSLCSKAVVNNLLVPVINRYLPEPIAQLQAQADAAAKALQDAKTALLQQITPTATTPTTPAP